MPNFRPSIIASELFGHEKAAFTDAVSSKEGKFGAAAGGTLLHDEIGELDAGLQAILPKVVEEKCVTRVGRNRAARDLGISPLVSSQETEALGALTDRWLIFEFVGA